MMGMHGEAWVNTAIQEADLLIALGMRFDDRVTGNLKTYAPNAKKIHIEHRPGRDQQERPRRRRRWSATCARRSSSCMPQRRRTRDRSEWLAHIDDAQGRRRGPRHPEPARQRPPLRRARHPRPVARSPRARRIVVTDVGQHQMWEAQYYKHDDPRTLITSGGLGTMGFALPAAIGAKLRAARRRGLGGRRRRRLPDDRVRAGDDRAGGHQASTSPSSTTASSAWCGSGRSSSTTAATPRRRCISPDFVKLAEAHGLTGMRVDDARRGRRRGRGGAQHAGHGASSTSASSRRTACTRWCRPAPTSHDMIRAPERRSSKRRRRTQ